LIGSNWLNFTAGAHQNRHTPP